MSTMQAVVTLLGATGLAAAVASIVTSLIQARTTKATAKSSDDARLRDELWREVGAQRERVGKLEVHLDLLRQELSEEKERASRARIAAAELVAATRGCIGDPRNCPVRALAEDFDKLVPVSPVEVPK